MGDRLTILADPQALHAATALLLLSPFIPLLFMGEEVFSQTPFLFFTDHNAELAELVRTGPARGIQAFRRLPGPGAAGAHSRPERGVDVHRIDPGL